MNKLKRFNKVLSFLAVFIMVAQSLISPVLAECEATVNNSESTEIRYAELTGDWSNDGLTNRFVVNYNGEDWHTGVCLEPTKNTPYGDMDYSTSYDGSSGIGRVLYWTIGRGYDDNHLYGASGTDYGPLSYEARFIIAHFAASYEANGGWDDGWTWMVGDGWRDAIIDIRNWCVNSGLNEGDGCEVIRVTPNDSGTSTQELALYWDWYTPPSHTDNYGKVDVLNDPPKMVHRSTPVKITIEKHNNIKNSNMHMIITIGQIKKEDLSLRVHSSDVDEESVVYGESSFTISIQDFIKYFNNYQSIIIKNLPDKILTDTQKKIKDKVISHDLKVATQYDEIHNQIHLLKQQEKALENERYNYDYDDDDCNYNNCNDYNNHDDDFDLDL